MPAFRKLRGRNPHACPHVDVRGPRRNSSNSQIHSDGSGIGRNCSIEMFVRSPHMTQCSMINDNVNVATLWPHPQSRLSRRGSSTCTTRELSAGLLSAQMRDVHLYRAARSSDETRILNTQALPLRVWRLWRCQRRVIWFSDFPLPISPLCRAGPFRPIGLIGDLPDSSLTCVSRRRMDSRPYVMASPTAISWPSARPHPPLSRSRSHPNPRRL